MADLYDISFFCMYIYGVWKNAYNSNAYLKMFRTSHNKIKDNIEILSFNCIW